MLREERCNDYSAPFRYIGTELNFTRYKLIGMNKNKEKQALFPCGVLALRLKGNSNEKRACNWIYNLTIICAGLMNT